MMNHRFGIAVTAVAFSLLLAAVAGTAAPSAGAAPAQTPSGITTRDIGKAGALTLTMTDQVADSDTCSFSTAPYAAEHCYGFLDSPAGGTQRGGGTFAGTLTATVPITSTDGLQTPATGTGPWTETVTADSSTVTATGVPSDLGIAFAGGLCGLVSARSDETYQGSTEPASYDVSGLQALTDHTGTVTDLSLTESFTDPPPGEHMRETDTLISAENPDTPGCSAGTSYTIDYVGDQGSGDYVTGIPESLFGIPPGVTGMTGWNIDPSGTWTPETGGVLAEKRLTVSTPEGAPDTGTITNNYVFQLVTGAAIKITSPPADKTIAVTDAKYFTPQPGPGERQPKQRKLTVEGTAPAGDTSIMLNGVQVPVTGGKWRGELPVTAAQLGRLTLKASDGKSTVEQRDTLIDIVITKPAENHQEPVTAVPAMPSLDATLNVPGYPGATAAVSFHWTLDVHGETVARPGAWTGYTQTTTGSTTGAGTAWKPAFAGIVGGVGHLTVTATLPKVLDNPVTSEPRWFGLPGTNPPPATAKAFIDQADRQYANPIRHLVCIESGWHQFNAAGYFPGNNNQPPVPGVPADWTPNPGTGQPLYGPPAGIGIAQLDPANLDEYWDWQANLQGGIGVWNDKLHQAQAWRQHEQNRLSARLQAALHQANVNRAAQHLPPLHLSPAQVPQLTAKQLIYQAIRLPASPR